VKLRDYQADWLRRAQSAPGRVLMVGPTGCGKTVVAAHLIRSYVERDKRVLFIAHRRELIYQCVERLRSNGITDIGITIAGQRSNIGASVQVASIQSLRSAAIGCDVIVIDEAHRATSTSYRAIIGKNKRAKVYGLTATPCRLDGRPLSDMFDSMVQSIGVEKLIEIGSLSKARVYSCRPEDLKGARIKGGDYVNSDVDAVVNTPHLVGDVIEHWERLACGQRTVVYANSISHAEHLVSRFIKRGHSARLLTGKTSHAERVETLEQIASGHLLIVVNVDVLTEGWDCPSVRCCVLARPTRSISLVRQMVGRVMRPGDVSPIVLDHAGNFLIHPLPHVGINWTLSARASVALTRGERSAQTKSCDLCGCMVASGERECPNCGHQYWGAIPTEHDVALQEFDLEFVAGCVSRDRQSEAYLKAVANINHRKPYDCGIKMNESIQKMLALNGVEPAQEDRLHQFKQVVGRWCYSRGYGNASKDTGIPRMVLERLYPPIRSYESDEEYWNRCSKVYESIKGEQ